MERRLHGLPGRRAERASMGKYRPGYCRKLHTPGQASILVELGTKPGGADRDRTFS